MQYFIIFTVIFTFAVMLTIVFKKRIEQVLPIGIVTIILIIYIAGMFDNLKIGVIITQIFTLLQLATILIIIKKKGKNEIKQILERILTPGLLVYVLLFVGSIIINKNRIFEDYDEFSHWGVIIKNMFNYNTFGTNEESIVRFNEYPPFTAIFQYLFLGIQKIYREDTIIIAQNILYFSIIIPITKTIKWDKSMKKLLAIIPILIFLPMIFYENFFLDILVDGLLGTMFAYTMFCAFEKEENIIFKYTKILAGLIMLCLTKTTGITLAIVAILIIFIKKLLEIKNKNEKLIKEMIAIIIIVVITTMLTSIWYSKTKNEEKRWDFKQIVQTEENRSSEQMQITKSFKNALIYRKNITSKELTTWTCILLLISLQIYTISKVKDKDYNYYSKATLITIPIYLIGLWITYITIFDITEAVQVTCFDRYTSTILLANAIFSILALADVEEWNSKKIFITISILLSLIPLTTIETKYIDGKNYVTMSNINRDIFTKINKYKDKLQTEDKILYIVGSKGKGELLTKMNEYVIMPIRIEETIKGDFDTLEQLEKMAKDYTHIFIYRMDKEDKENVKAIFENKTVKNDTLYKVEYENEKIILKVQ